MKEKKITHNHLERIINHSFESIMKSTDHLEELKTNFEFCSSELGILLGFINDWLNMIGKKSIALSQPYQSIDQEISWIDVSVALLKDAKVEP